MMFEAQMDIFPRTKQSGNGRVDEGSAALSECRVLVKNVRNKNTCSA